MKNCSALSSLILLLLLLAEVGAQSSLFTLGIELDECGQQLTVPAETTIELSGFLTLSTLVFEVAAVTQSIEFRAPSWANVCLDILPTQSCDRACKEALLGVAIIDFLNVPTAFVIQREDTECAAGRGDPDDEVNLGRRGIVDSTVLQSGESFAFGTSRIVPFTIRIRTPDFQATIPIELEHVDGLRGLGSPTNNGVSFLNQTIGLEPDPTDRFVIANGCAFTVVTLLETVGIKPGDANTDGRVDLNDAIWMLRYLFLGDPTILPCGDGSDQDLANVELLDASGDSVLNVTDPIIILAWRFLGGSSHVRGTGCITIPNCPAPCS